MDKEREENSVKAGQIMQEIQLNMDIKEQGAGKMPRKEWMKMQIESRSENEEFARVTVGGNQLCHTRIWERGRNYLHRSRY